MNKEIGFNDLSFLLKLATIGGLISLVSFLIGFFIGLGGTL